MGGGVHEKFRVRIVARADEGVGGFGCFIFGLRQTGTDAGRDVVKQGHVERKKSPSKRANVAAASQRRVLVFASLLTALTLVSALLLALAPAPLRPSAVRSLFALGAPQSLECIFDTSVPVQQHGRWNSIYVRHSQSLSGSALTLAETPGGLPDHFVIGNGDGCVDGELQIGQRWTEQLPPGLPPGLDRIEPGCISICLIGNFDQTGPTQTQQRRLVQLLGVLQSRLQIPAEQVILVPTGGPAGVGTRFPLADMKVQLRP